MLQKYGKLLVGILIGCLFLWLAFRDVEISEVVDAVKVMTWWWVPFYILTMLFSHYARAERWRLLFEINSENKLPNRFTLFNAVMLGYLVNYAVPRLGEVSRAVYVVKKEGGSNSWVLGTVFLERFVDMLILLICLAFTAFFVVSEPAALRAIFGNEFIELARMLLDPSNLSFILIAFIVLLLIAYGIHHLLELTGNKFDIVGKAYTKFKDVSRLFADGMLSLRRVRNWPLFIGTTLAVWLGYTLLAYIPFYGFAMISGYELGFREAFVVMVVSAIGVALPSPGGVGTYHWFVGQTLIVLYMVPAALAMAYAFVTHAVMMALIIIITPACLLLLEKRNGQSSPKL